MHSLQAVTLQRGAHVLRHREQQVGAIVVCRPRFVVQGLMRKPDHKAGGKHRQHRVRQGSVDQGDVAALERVP